MELVLWRSSPVSHGRSGTFAMGHVQKAQCPSQLCWPRKTVFLPFLPSPGQPKSGQISHPVGKEGGYGENSKLLIQSLLSTAGFQVWSRGQGKPGRQEVPILRCWYVLQDTVILHTTWRICQNPKKSTAQEWTVMYTNLKLVQDVRGFQERMYPIKDNVIILQIYETTHWRGWGEDAELSNFGNQWSL